MDYRYLKAFVLTAQKCSFTKAASELGVAQSAISRQVALFEESVGRQLLIRSQKSVMLTPEGQDLLVHLQKFEAQNRNLLEPDERPIRIVTKEGILNCFLADKLAKIKGLPNLTIDIGESSTIREGVEQGAYDLAFSVEDLSSALYSSQKLYDEEFALISTKPVDIKNLHKETWIFSEHGSQLKRLCRKSPKGQIRVRPIEIIVKLVMAGQGIAVVPRHLIPKTKRLRVQPLPQAAKSSVYMCTLNYTIVPPPLRRLSTAIAED